MAAKKTDETKLEEIRQRVRDLQAERDDLNRRPVSREEAIAALDRWLQDQRDEHWRETNVNGLLKGSANLSLHVTRFTGDRDFAPLLAAAIPDSLRAYYVERIDAALAERAPMSTAERQHRASEIDGELYRLEAEEEQIVRRLNADGERVVRRGDQDPRTVLGLTAPPSPPSGLTKTKPEPDTYRDGRRDVTHPRLPAEE